jgi:hypothetical protein
LRSQPQSNCNPHGDHDDDDDDHGDDDDHNGVHHRTVRGNNENGNGNGNGNTNCPSTPKFTWNSTTTRCNYSYKPGAAPSAEKTDREHLRGFCRSFPGRDSCRTVVTHGYDKKKRKIFTKTLYQWQCVVE